MAAEIQQVEMLCPCTKTYKVIRKYFRGDIYNADVSSIAQWFYLSNINTNNITIIIHGGFHETYPNRAHLTIVIEYDGITTGRMHLSLNDHGHWYQQQLHGTGYGIKRKTRKSKRKNKHKKRKRKGKKSRRR